MLTQKKYGILLGYCNIIVKNLVQLVYTPMLLYFVGQGDFGVFQTINSFTLTLTIFSVGFTKAYVRFYSIKAKNNDTEGIKNLNGLYLLLYLGISVIVLIFGLIFALTSNAIFCNSFSKEEIELSQKLILIMVISITITIFSSVFDSYILVREKFKFQQSRQLFTTLATPFLSYFLLLCGFGAVGVGLSQLFITILLLVLNINFAIKKIKMQFGFRNLQLSLFKSIFVFSIWIFANQICDLINNNIPNVILGSLTSSSVVAVFAIAIQIRTCFILFSTTISNVFVPQVNTIVATTNNNDQLSKLITRVGRYQMFLLCWIYGAFVVIGRFFMLKWAGDSFDDAYFMLCIMMLPLIIPLSQNVGIEIQYAKNKHKARSCVYLFMAVINVLITILFSKNLGYWAPTLAYFLSITLGNCIFMNWYYKKYIGINIKFFWKKTGPIFVSGLFTTVLFLVITYILPVNNWLSFIVVGLLFTFVFFTIIWFIILNKFEKQKILCKIWKKK